MSLSRPSKAKSLSQIPNQETSPLIPTHHPNDPPHDHSSSPSPTLTTLILYFMALYFLISFCEMVVIAPLISLFESSLCQSFYDFPNTGITNQEMCKIPEIQGPLATIRGWKSFGDTVPVLLVAIPIGSLGDSYGRRKIMALSLIGVGLSLVEIFVVCAFPEMFDLRWVWLSPAFLLCGGGLYSSAAFMFAMASSLIPEDRRSYAFYYIFSAFCIAELVGSYIASITIDISPWIACGMAMGSLILALALLWMVPLSQATLQQPESPSHPAPSSSPPLLHLQDDIPILNPTILTTVRQALTQSNALLCIPIFLVGTLRYTTLSILIQYFSVHFSQKISQGATFYAETAIINIILFNFLIPRATAYLQSKYNAKPEKIDLALVRISLGSLLLGSLAIGLSPSREWILVGVSILAAGFGLRVSTLSLISHFIPPSSIATIYASIAVLENLGHAITDPSMQHIFAATLRLPPFWHALPFFITAICYSLAGLSTIFIKINKTKSNDNIAEN